MPTAFRTDGADQGSDVGFDLVLHFLGDSPGVPEVLAFVAL